GPVAARVAKLCRTADVVLNVSGVNPIRSWFEHAPVRVLIDTDPVFTQIRHLLDPSARRRAEQHTAFMSFGENFGKPDCTIPDDGFPWPPPRQPVVLDACLVTAGPEDGLFTTVMQWDSYPAREFGGRRFGMKSQSFEPYWLLPSRTRTRLRLAL